VPAILQLVAIIFESSDPFSSKRQLDFQGQAEIQHIRIIQLSYLSLQGNRCSLCYTMLNGI
jgi:hypothetical protein